MFMEDRRKIERFGIHAPARVETALQSGDCRTFSLMTRDLSSSGAFVSTQEPLGEGVKVKLELQLTLRSLQRFAGAGERAKVLVRGTIVRSDENGMAIAFQGRHKFVLGRTGVHDL